jgi:glycosyltransferase involved in cell wall biosynthesis
MKRVAYYLPNIPANPSTARYNHAVEVTDLADQATLITYPESPPEGIADRFSTVHVLESNGIRNRAIEARDIADTFLGEFNQRDAVYLTSFHYAPALSCRLSDNLWVVDVYDDPHQLRYHNPRSWHHLGVPVLTRLLKQSHRAVQTVHPSTSHTFGQGQFFALNGADVANIEPNSKSDASGPLKGVCAGVKGGLDVLLHGIATSTVDIEVDVFGAVSTANRALLSDLKLDNRVSLHGNCKHPLVVEAIQAADVGFCMFPNKTDWYYAQPIKIGEYLAGGTIPIASAYPGIRQLTRDSGMLVEYDSDAVAEALTELHERPELRERLRARCRQRAEAIDWREEREWFAKQALYGNGTTKN